MRMLTESPTPSKVAQIFRHLVAQSRSDVAVRAACFAQLVAELSVDHQVTSAAGPYMAGYFMEHLMLSLPLEFAAAMQGLSTVL
jgi:hypothetical protein